MKDCHVAIVRGECLQLVDRAGKPIPGVGMIGVPWTWRGALHAYQAPEPAPAASVADDAAFQTLLHTIRGAASDAQSCGRDFGTGHALDVAEQALESYVDALLAAARSA